MDDGDLDLLRDGARVSLKTLRGLCNDDDLACAKQLVEALRNVREYELMGQLAEAVSRLDPKDAKNRRLYAQFLIDTGKASAAIDLLRPLAQRLPKTDAEFAEATGLLGRAYKQIFFEAGDKSADGARDALEQAIAAYRAPYEDNAANTWHGVNLLALVSRARRLGIRMAPELQPKALARQLVATLEATPEDRRDPWFRSTLAEASLGLDDWDAVERHLRAYVTSADAKAFQVAGTIRQFTEVWDLEGSDERGRGLIDILRARLLALPGGGLTLTSDQLQDLRARQTPGAGQLEAVLGAVGAQTFSWWKAGLDCARSVASIRQRLGGRIGTGFLVRAGDLGRTPAGELLVLTNFHVVNAQGVSPGIRPGNAEVVFEAVDTGQVHTVNPEIVWSSPPESLDASLLRLAVPVSDIEPLRFAAALPALEGSARVYVIGHPGGRDLSFSFQDNELLDHEGPPAGKPQIPGLVRVHYRAPTEGGSSGSPVFDAQCWEVIALHHRGGKIGMPRLNGANGTYAANEGIAIQSIAAAARG